MPEVTRQQIVDAIVALGVRPGDLLLAHSSLSSFGHVIGGASAVAHALVEVTGSTGTAFVPTFTYATSPFDPESSASLDGAISEAFRQLPGALRSLHPTHSVTGRGPQAQEILAGHERVQPFGEGSPLWRLWERDAWVLLIGCDHRANSMIHVAEEKLAMPYLDRRRKAQVIRAGGSVEEVEVRRPGCSAAFNAVEPYLSGAMRSTRVGLAFLQLIRARDVVDATMTLLRQRPQALLCDNPQCSACVQARQMLQRESRG